MCPWQVLQSLSEATQKKSQPGDKCQVLQSLRFVQTLRSEEESARGQVLQSLRFAQKTPHMNLPLFKKGLGIDKILANGTSLPRPVRPRRIHLVQIPSPTNQKRHPKGPHTPGQ